VSSPSHERDDHLTDVEIAAYLDRTLSPSLRDRAENHLAACPDCRRHLLETRELLERVRRPRKYLIGGTVAAAAVLALLIARPNVSSIDRPDLMRNDEAAVPLLAYGPMGPVIAAETRFVWSAAPGAQSYRLTVSRANAGAVWSSSGIDTVAMLPDSVVLRPSERYFWVTDALLSDGTTRSTGIREFVVVR
jgi:anti-sigma factor RsiW